MTERPKTPADLAKRTKPKLRATAEFYAQRARWARDPRERARLIAEADRYHALAQLEEEVARIHPKPPAASI